MMMKTTLYRPVGLKELHLETVLNFINILL